MLNRKMGSWVARLRSIADVALSLEPTSSGFRSEAGNSFTGDNGTGFVTVGHSSAGATGSFDAFFRFPNVTIPNGATIKSAKLRWMPQGYNNTGQSTELAAVDAADPAAPTDVASFNALTPTTARVDYDPSAAGVPVDVETETPDLTAIIQELVDSYDYSGGAAIIILWLDDGSSTDAVVRPYSAYSPESDFPPVLEITY